MQLYVFVFGATAPPPAVQGLIIHEVSRSQTTCTTVGRTSLEKRSARRRDLYLTTHNTHKRQTSMPPVGFEPTFLLDERPQTYALDRAATGTGSSSICSLIFKSPVVTKSTMYCNTKTYAFSAEFNSAIRKILKHGN